MGFLNVMMSFLVALSLKVSTFALSLEDLSDDSVIVARVGDSVVLRSSYQSCPVWTHSGVDGRYIEVYDCKKGIHGRYRDRLSHHSNGTASALNITNITTNDAGRYECQNSNSDSTLFSAKLTVIDGAPRCSSASHIEYSDENDNRGKCRTWHRIELFCRITFHGLLNSNSNCPLEWRKVGKEDSLRSECRINSTAVVSTLTLDPKSHTNDSSYVCIVTSCVNASYSCAPDIISRFSTECETDSSDSRPTTGEMHPMTITNPHINISSSSSSLSITDYSFWSLFSMSVLLHFFRFTS